MLAAILVFPLPLVLEYKYNPIPLASIDSKLSSQYFIALHALDAAFLPSAVLYAVYDSKTGIDDNYRLALNFNSDGFITQSRTAPPIGGGIETFSYIAFR